MIIRNGEGCQFFLASDSETGRHGLEPILPLHFSGNVVKAH